MNSARLRQMLSNVQPSATLAGSRVFPASSARRAFRAAVSAVKGGRGGRVMVDTYLSEVKSSSGTGRSSRVLKCETRRLHMISSTSE